MTRVRNRSTLAVAQLGTWTEKHYFRTPACTNAAAWVVHQSGALGEWRGTYEVMTDTVVDNFAKRKAKGEVFFNPMSQIKQTLGASSGSSPSVRSATQSCSSPYNYYEEWRYENVAPWMFTTVSGSTRLPGVMPYDHSLLMREASTSVLNRRGRTDTNLYEAVAELHKSFSVLQVLFKKLHGILSKKGVLEKLSEGSGAYLVVRYGIQPIVKDVETVLLGMKATVGKVRVTSRSTVSDTASLTVLGPSISWDTWFNFRVRSVSTATITVRAMSLDEFLATRGSNIGFTGKGLATLPWELVRLSFVVDWIVNVGDLLGAMIPAFGWNQLGSCMVVTNETKTVHTAETTAVLPGWTSLVNVSGTKTDTAISKTRITGLSQPGLVIKSDFRLDSATRAMDALALILQRLR